MKIKRNYRFLQFLLDLFSLFQLYMICACIIDVFDRMKRFNVAVIRVEGAEEVMLKPGPCAIWGALSFVVFAAAVILPFWYAKRTRLNQRQFDMWAYAVYLVRSLVMLILFYMLDIHVSYIAREPKSPIDFSILASVIFTVIIVRFTQIRIKKAKPEEIKDKREFVED